MCDVWVVDDPRKVITEHGINDAAARDLPLRLDIRSHSPTGFEWGYDGSGPAQLALALLADALGNDELAQNHYQQFKRNVISQLPDTWMLTASEIRRFVAAVHQEGSSAQNCTGAPHTLASPAAGKVASKELDFREGNSVVSFETGIKFSLGEIVVTSGALRKLPPEDITAAVRRHARGDWGELDFENAQLNDLRVQEGGPIASIYRASNGVKFYVLTESDRSVTTLLLPEEY
ncbi:MAG: DUF6166 domain-containing protein [Verrucomicrobiales bacterium]|nr:DUF6166 domain-containing protein [Verrucomicrobiales bacterium]